MSLQTRLEIRSHYELFGEDLLEILKQNRNQIQATDNLIDQIFYKLYGLTEEEIRIVEGQV